MHHRNSYILIRFDQDFLFDCGSSNIKCLSQFAKISIGSKLSIFNFGYFRPLWCPSIENCEVSVQKFPFLVLTCSVFNIFCTTVILLTAWLWHVKVVGNKIIILVSFSEHWCSPTFQTCHQQKLSSQKVGIILVFNFHRLDPVFSLLNVILLTRNSPFLIKSPFGRTQTIHYKGSRQVPDFPSFRVPSIFDFKSAFKNCSLDQRDYFTRDNIDSPLTMVYMSRQMMNILCFIMDLIIWGWEMKTLSHINLLAPSLMLLMSH